MRYTPFFILIISLLPYSCFTQSSNDSQSPLTPAEVIAKYDYDVVSEFNSGLAIARKNDQRFVIDQYAKKVFDWPYDQHEFFYKEGYAKVKKDGLYGLIDIEGKEIMPCKYDHISNLIRYNTVVCTYKMQHGIFFLEDNNFKPIPYRVAGLISQNKIIVSNLSSEYAVIDLDGNFIHPFQEHWIRACCGHYTLQQDGKLGVLNENGETVVPFEYDFIIMADMENFAVSKDGKQGRINLQNEILYPFLYEQAANLGDVIQVKENKLYGLSEMDANLLTEIKYSNISSKGHGYYQLTSPDGVDLYNAKQKTVEKLPFDKMQKFKDGFAIVITAQDTFTVDTFLNKVPMTSNIKKPHIVSNQGNAYHRNIYKRENAGYIWVKNENNLHGLLNLNKDEIIPNISDKEVKLIDNGFDIARNGKKEFLDFSGTVINTQGFNISNTRTNNSYQVYSQNNSKGYPIRKYGLYQVGKGLILDTIYSSLKISRFDSANNFVTTQDDDGKYSIFDTNRPEKKYAQYDELGLFNLFYLLARKGDHWGMINANEEIIIPFEYESLKKHSNNVFIAQKGGKYIILNALGKNLTDGNYDSITALGNYLSISKNGLYGMLNRFAKPLLPLEYQNTKGFHFENRAVFKKNDKWGVINKENEVIVDFQYDDINSFNSRTPYFIVINDTKKGLLDLEGNTVLPVEYTEIKYIQDSLIWVKKDLWRLINTDGKMMTELKFDKINSWRSGFSQVWINDKTGYINTKGEIVVPISFDKVRLLGKSDLLPNGGFKVTIGEHSMQINKENKCVENCLPDVELKKLGVSSK